MRVELLDKHNCDPQLVLVLTFALEFFFLDAALLAPPLLKPILSSDKTRCCSSSDKLCRYQHSTDVISLKMYSSQIWNNDGRKTRVEIETKKRDLH